MTKSRRLPWLGALLLAAWGAAACSSVPQSPVSQPVPAVVTAPALTPTTAAPGPPTQPAVPAAPRQYSYSVVNAYPHDASAFTQGLVFDGGFLYEGTGLYGRSSLRRVQMETGRVLKKIDLPAQYFGEGIAVYRDRIVQLTWTSGVGFVYDRDTFQQVSEFYYPTEGWGITHDGSRLIMSDGTSVLRFLDPNTFAVTGQVTVNDGGNPVSRLNELEFVRGRVYANVWQTDRIAIIDPTTGSVTGWIDLAGLLKTRLSTGTEDVLNGIAYDAAGDRLLVTGKLWQWLFEVRLSERP